MIKRTDGDQKNFDKNWNDRKETVYNHWAKHNPVNQVQLAFSSHWEVFSQFLADHSTNKGKVLEVGSGRGSLSSYFSQDGWDCTLLDSSPKVLEVAKLIYEKNGHSGTFILGDANSLPFDNDLFDVVFSIGLLEHFEDVSHVISEQIRVLRPNGRFFAYIIPERGDNIQKYFNWFNNFLKKIVKNFHPESNKVKEKAEIYRNTYNSSHYNSIMTKLGCTSLTDFGMYPLPMISHSPEFPFSLMNNRVELLLTRIFQFVLSLRKFYSGRHGWICSEKMGQAFLVTCRKIN